MKILIFLHGTTIMHEHAAGRTREERVQQVREKDASIRDYAAYVPVGGAASKLRTWTEQGAEILYLSSHRAPEDVAKDRSVLVRHGFPEGPALYRRTGEGYEVVAERVMPDVLIEDSSRMQYQEW